MKSDTISKIVILISLGIIFILSPFIFTITNFSAGNKDSNSEYRDEMNPDIFNLKISAISGKIHINNNWSAAKIVGNFTGNGSYSEPYIIEDLVIDANNTGSCILIENSNVYFRIENCTVYNSVGFKNAGIKFNNVTHSQLVDNNCSSNYNGIYLENSENNTISGNTVELNVEYGIKLYNSSENTVSGNDVSSNMYGIDLYDSDYNNVSLNYADINQIYGIHLSYSNYNTISGNNANSNKVTGIYLYNSHVNTISGNTANDNLYGLSFHLSNNNPVSGNTVNNNLYGVRFSSSYNNPISGNNVIFNDIYGIHLSYSNYNTLSGNTVKDNDDGIYLYYGNNNVLSGNTVNNNDDGLRLYHSDDNDLIGNNVSFNNNGLYLSTSDDNTVTDNNFINNYNCWRESNCEGNSFENNQCVNMPPPPGSFNVQNILAILIGIHLFIGIMVVIRILSKRGFFHSRRNNIPKIDRNKPLQQTPQRAINGSKSCPNCGTLITKESSLFCTNCGQKL